MTAPILTPEQQKDALREEVEALHRIRDKQREYQDRWPSLFEIPLFRAIGAVGPRTPLAYRYEEIDRNARIAEGRKNEPLERTLRRYMEGLHALSKESK